MKCEQCKQDVSELLNYITKGWRLRLCRACWTELKQSNRKQKVGGN